MSSLPLVNVQDSKVMVNNILPLSAGRVLEFQRRLGADIYPQTSTPRKDSVVITVIGSTIRDDTHMVLITIYSSTKRLGMLILAFQFARNK